MNSPPVPGSTLASAGPYSGGHADRRRLVPADRGALAEDLPAPLGALLLGEAHAEGGDAAEFFRDVAQQAGLREAQAVEVGEVVLGVLAESVGEDWAQRAGRDLPAQVAQHLRPRAAETAPPPPHLHPEHRTLAEAQAASAHPLFAARPDRTQSGSVVASDNPHGDTKLSSARGVAQEREARTLATAGSPAPDGDGEEKD